MSPCAVVWEPPRYVQEKKARQSLLIRGICLLQKAEVMQMIGSVRECLGGDVNGFCIKTIDPRTQEELVIKTFGDNALDTLVDEAVILK